MDQTADLWWEARKQTAALSQEESVFIKKTVSFPGRSTTLTFEKRDGQGLVVDLNKYRPDRNLRKLYEMGVDAFFLRMGGPLNWIMDNWKYTKDPTFRPYMEQLEKLGLLGRSVGYIIHNPFEIWKTGADIHIDLINEWTSAGYMPRGLCLDHEVANCWQNNVLIKATPYNLVGSLEATSQKVWDVFKKVPILYLARWFLNQNNPGAYDVYFDRVNGSSEGKTRLIWMAWYPQTFPKVYTNLQHVLNDLIVPNGDQQTAYLNIGSHSTVDLWQFSDRIKIEGDPTGFDTNMTWKPLPEFLTDFGLDSRTIELPPAPPEPKPLTVTTRVGIVKSGGLRVRSAPNTTSMAHIYFTLSVNEKVEILEEKEVGEALWYRIGTKQWACARTSKTSPHLIDLVMA